MKSWMKNLKKYVNKNEKKNKGTQKKSDWKLPTHMKRNDEWRIKTENIWKKTNEKR